MNKQKLKQREIIMEKLINMNYKYKINTNIFAVVVYPKNNCNLFQVNIIIFGRATNAYL